MEEADAVEAYVAVLLDPATSRTTVVVKDDPPGVIKADDALMEARLKRIVVAATMEATAATVNLMVQQ